MIVEYKEIFKLKVMLEREKQNYIDLLDILKGSDKDDC